MNRFFAGAMVCVSLVLFAGGVCAQEFRADMVTNSKDGSMQGVVTVSNDMIRMEMEPAITIVRLDKKLMWMLMPEQKMYMEMPVDTANLTMLTEKSPGEVSRKLLGSELVGGRDTEKYEVTYKDQGKIDTVYVWFSKELRFPLKSSALDGSWTVEYANVKEGIQPREMFELPGGYTKFDYGATPAEAAGN
ncbi:MAG: DUF4412 domain-containing protein [Candidatus Omnitrophota bacterium]